MNLDLALLLASIIFTILLAAVGVEMANNPPTSCTTRWIYRCVFIILGSLLVGATYWQGKRNIDEQNRIKSVAEAQEKKLDDRYNEIKTQYSQLEGRLISIQNFSKHPPANLTPQQVGEAIRTMAGTGNLKQRTIELAKTIQQGMHDREQTLFQIQAGASEGDRKNSITIPQSLSLYFRFHYLPRVIEVRDELASRGFKNKDLDDFIKNDQMEVAGRQDMLTMGAKISPVVSISPFQIQQVVDALNAMAGQMKD